MGVDNRVVLGIWSKQHSKSGRGGWYPGVVIGEKKNNYLAAQVQIPGHKAGKAFLS